MNLIAIRHGEVPLNAESRTTGWIDEDLTPNGLLQAQTLASTLEADFSAIIASPLRRTLSTARAIAEKHPCSIVLDPNLRERNFGALNGKTWPEIQAETGTDLRPFEVSMTYDYRSYGGESVADVTARTQAFLHTALQLQITGDLVVVTHGGIIKILYTLLESIEPRHPITNCSVHIFRSQLKERSASGSPSTS